MDRKMVQKWLTENKQTAAEILFDLINLADLENDQVERDLEIKKLIWKIENKIELGS